MKDNYLTVNARQSINIIGLAEIGSLRLAVNVDDGFVCYINRREAVRAYAGDPGQELSFDDPATVTHKALGLEYFDLTDSIDDLTESENLIAVESHNFTLDSSDLTFNARLSANDSGPATFTDAEIEITGSKAPGATSTTTAISIYSATLLTSSSTTRMASPFSKSAR